MGHVAHDCRYCHGALDLLTWECTVDGRVVRYFAWVCPACDRL